MKTFRTMKRLFTLLCAFAALCSCSTIELPDPVGNEVPEKVGESARFTFKVTVDAPATKASSKTAWVDGDVIYVRFAGISDKYLYLTYNAAADSWAASESSAFSDADFDGKSRYCHAIYFPVPVSASFDGGNLEFLEVAPPNGWVGTYYLEAENVSYSVSGTEVSFGLKLVIPDNSVQFHIPGFQSSYADYSFVVSHVRPRYVTGLQDDGIHYQFGFPTASLPAFVDEDGVVYSGYIDSPGDELNYTFSLSKGANDYYFYKKTRALTAGSFYKFKEVSDPMWSCLIGAFSVAADRQVRFSRGNLQYVGTWQFADRQWYSFGGDGQSDDHRDLLGWGTKTAPNNTSDEEGDYADWADWGENAILNGGNTENYGWRTLDADEWTYLIENRENAGTKHGYGTVAGQIGTILLPDNWSGPDLSRANRSYTDNVITAEAWTDSWEIAGAVFLPSEGGRVGTEAFHTEDGLYWTYEGTGSGISQNTLYTFVYEGGLDTYAGGGMSRAVGCCVRLVMDK